MLTINLYFLIVCQINIIALLWDVINIIVGCNKNLMKKLNRKKSSSNLMLEE